VGRWAVAVLALVVGVGAGFALARATASGTPKRTVEVSRVFINARQGESGTWATGAIRHACRPGNVSVVRVTIVRVTVGGHAAWSFPKTTSYKCDDFMRQFQK